MSDVTQVKRFSALFFYTSSPHYLGFQYLEYQKNSELSRDNFTFSCRVILGDYLQPVPSEMQTDGTEFIHLTEEDVNRRYLYEHVRILPFKCHIFRLEELKAAMRTSLPVEQRIEMARKQQAARAAARLDREQARIYKEMERTERQEQARREREAKTQQILEVCEKFSVLICYWCVY